MTEPDVQLTDFLEYAACERHLTANTLSAYRSDLLQYAGFAFQQRQCTAWPDVDELVVRKYVLWLKENGNALSTVARKVAAIRGFHRFLVMHRGFASDPTYALELPRPPLRPLPLLTLSQVQQLLEAPDSETAVGRRDRAVLELLYASGIQISELIALNYEDVHLDLCAIHCGAVKRNERVVPFGHYARQALATYMERDKRTYEKSGAVPLFINGRGGRFSRQGIWKTLKQYGVVLGISQLFSPETLRQSLAVHLLENGADLQSVDTLLGRKSVLHARQVTAHLPLNTFYHRYHPRA
ncbi:MAG: tyrosine-type recombinase/integrase [Sporolactobacillus sp.]